MQVRQHRRLLDESMETVETIEPTMTALVAWAERILAQWDIPKPFDIRIKPYGYDGRIKWNTHIVKLEGYGVLGFTDGPLISP
jgi:hypothetical protein